MLLERRSTNDPILPSNFLFGRGVGEVENFEL